MIEPEACKDLSDVRRAVRALDRDIVALLARRERYVRAAVRFKQTESELRDRTHISTHLEQRRAWAKEFGADPDLVERIFRAITDYSEIAQSAVWHERHG